MTGLSIAVSRQGKFIRLETASVNETIEASNSFPTREIH